MADQPNAPKMASKATLAMHAVRSNMFVAGKAVADQDTKVTMPDDGPITVTAFGRTFQVTVTDVTNQD